MHQVLGDDMITGMGFIGTKTGGLYRMNGRRTVKKTASGNPITLTDSVENKPLGMTLYGWSKQDGTPSPENPVEIESAGMRWSMGKNLVNADDYYSAYKQADGTYKGMVGTVHNIRIKATSDMIGKTYTISEEVTVPAEVISCRIECVVNGSSIFSNRVMGGNSGKMIVKFTPTSVDDYFCITYGDCATCSIMFYNLQLELGSVATSYEPYTGGVPKPYGDKVGVVVGGANIFSFENFIALETYSDSGYDVRNIQLKPDTMYYFYVPNRKSNAEVGVWLFQSNSENNINDRGFIGLTTNYEEAHSIKTDSTGILKIGCAFSLGIKDENYLNDNLIISLNPVDAYEHYRTPQSTAIVTPNGLPGIPVPSNTAGITYTDANGQAWIADDIDLERGKYVQRVWQAEFDGSEKRWVLYKHVQYSGFAIKVLPHEKMMRRYGLCTQYKTENLPTSNEAIWIGANDDVLYVKNSRFHDASLDDGGLSNFKSHLAANPLVVMTYLDTPIERDLTSAELAEYTQLYSYKPTTVVENDSDCWMDVTYRGKK